jgi:antitoxin HigA-1
MNLVDPGEILAEDFLQPLGISQYRLAKDIHVPLRRVNKIVSVRRGVSADTALRLARYFNTTPQFWSPSLGAYPPAERPAQKE